VGNYSVKVKLHHEVTASLTAVVEKL
jgi:ribosomal protein L9